jgi:hypothetical protein
VPVVKLTVKSIGKLVAPDPSRKQIAHWDTGLKGFGVLCTRPELSPHEQPLSG